MSDEAELEADAQEGSAPPPRAPQSASEAVVIAAVVTLAAAAVTAFAFSPERAGSPVVLVAIGALYAMLAAAALYRMQRRGELLDQMRPRYGDLALGAAAAALLYGVAMAVHLAVTGPGSPRAGWIMRIFLQIGDPHAEGRILVSASVFLIAALEEIAWRGLVLRALAARWGANRAWIVTTALYGVAHIPTLFLLADPKAGPNPLVVIAALGCGLVWGRIAIRTERLVPAIFAHALFSWAIVELPIWRP